MNNQATKKYSTKSNIWLPLCLLPIKIFQNKLSLK